MNQQVISSLFNVRPVFFRSVDVTVDYNDPRSSEHYVATDLVRETLARVIEGLQVASSQRAWRLTGDYGTGKSSFALALARIAAGNYERLPSSLRSHFGQQLRLEPVLVAGEQEPIRSSIVRGLREAEIRVFGGGNCISPVLSNDGLLTALDQLGERIRTAKIGNGILLILDELGQNLRYAGQHPDDDDIFLLQRLAEKAVRSNGSPLMVVALLHQGLASYSAAAGSVVKKDWDKVAGRYEEVVFAQPVEQIAVLLAETLGVQATQLPKKIRVSMREAMRGALTCGLYGSLAAEKSLLSIAPHLFPLSPIVLPILVSLLRNFGQNERSIVSFATSFEPFGLRYFSERTIAGEGLYRLSDLYDYFKANLSRLSPGPTRSRWDIAESIVDRGSAYGKTAEKLLKAVALMNMIDDPALPSTREVLLASESESDAVEVLERLVSDLRLLHERGVVKGLSLWPQTSANLDDLLQQAKQAIGRSEPSPSALFDYLPERQMVARRHYVQTGNLRHFSVHYVSGTDAEGALQQMKTGTSADGMVVVAIPFSVKEQSAILQMMTTKKLAENVVCGISTPIAGVTHLLSQLKLWEWVKNNSPELSFDQFARDYVRDAIERMKSSLHHELEFLTDFVVDSTRPIRWFHNGQEIQIEEHRGIAGYLSVVCSELYPKAPKVLNELINRRLTSSAASRARTLLIEAIATRSTEEYLGLNGDRNPPELAIYLSVLREGKVHVRKDDLWQFVPYSEMSEDPCRLGPSLKRIHEILTEADLDRVPVNRIFEELRRPPFGVRDGLMPLLLAVYLAAHWQETSVYEDGTFLLKAGGDQFQRLTKEPEAFALQHCSISGVRLEVYHQLCKALGGETNLHPDVLTVVRPLVSFAVQLPEYAKQAREALSPQSCKVRDVLLSARQPVTLLFKELPEALDLPIIGTGAPDQHQITSFLTGLTEAIAELRDAYSALLLRIRGKLQASLGMSPNWNGFRDSISKRSEVTVGHISDLNLKAFVFRIGDKTLADTQWIESIGTLVAKKAPERWHDSDEHEFYERIEALASRFKRVESVGSFNGNGNDAQSLDRCIRLTVTTPNGFEANEILHWTPEDDHRLQRAEKALNVLIHSHGRFAIAAAARLFCQRQAIDEKDEGTE